MKANDDNNLHSAFKGIWFYSTTQTTIILPGINCLPIQLLKIRLGL